ncbi:hypothetical protein PtB15_3B656 [Puccinia triticina]|nr:hypothetical protein PtB15_3B656 [Puccinia triticina]
MVVDIPSDIDSSESSIRDLTPAPKRGQTKQPKNNRQEPTKPKKKSKKSEKRVVNDEGESKISLEYALYIATDEEITTTRGSHKRKPPPNARKLKYDHIVSTPGKIFLFWNLSDDNLTAFKQAAFGAIRELNSDVFAERAEEQDAAKLVTWYASIPHGSAFKAGNRATIDTDDQFTEFLEEAAEPDGYKFIVSINEVNPKTVAQREAAIEKLEVSKGKKKKSAVDVDEWQPLAGATHSANVIDLIALIKSKHPPNSKLTGFHELPVYINPKNPLQYMSLDPNRLANWAKAIMKPGPVNEYHPPKDPSFDWDPPRSTAVAVPTSVIQQSPLVPTGPPTTPQVQFLYAWDPLTSQMKPYMAGHGPAPMSQAPPLSYQSPSNPWPTQSTSHVAQPVSLPAPSDEPDGLEDYLLFTHVDPHCPKLQEGLDKLGINHYSKLYNMQSEELEEAGLKKADARALISNLKKYEHHRKKIVLVVLYESSTSV